MKSLAQHCQVPVAILEHFLGLLWGAGISLGINCGESSVL